MFIYPHIRKRLGFISSSTDSQSDWFVQLMSWTFKFHQFARKLQAKLYTALLEHFHSPVYSNHSVLMASTLSICIQKRKHTHTKGLLKLFSTQSKIYALRKSEKVRTQKSVSRMEEAGEEPRAHKLHQQRNKTTKSWNERISSRTFRTGVYGMPSYLDYFFTTFDAEHKLINPEDHQNTEKEFSRKQKDQSDSIY